MQSPTAIRISFHIVRAALSCAALSPLFLFLSFGQQAGTAVLRGEIENGHAAAMSDLTVELVERGRVVGRAAVFANGSFEIQGVEPGVYDLRVLNFSGAVLKQDFVVVQNHSSGVVIQLPATNNSPPAAGSVSIRQWMAPVPGRALKELAKAEKAARKGDEAASILHLRSAVRIHPVFLAAHQRLGLMLMAQGKFEEAAQEFRTAIQIDSSSLPSQAGLAFALVFLKSYREAEFAARKALQLDRNSTQAAYALGLSLTGAGVCSEEAVENLERATRLYERARLSYAKILACRGDLAGAARQLRQYLKTPEAEYTDEVRAWLHAIEKKDALGNKIGAAASGH
jgi:tetratricopeptide (TPR) repeat protein